MKDKVMVFNYRILLIDKSGKFNYVVLTLDKALSGKSCQKILADMKLFHPDLDDIIIAPATTSQMDRDPTREDVFTVVDMLASCISCILTDEEAKDLLQTAITELELTSDNEDNGGKYAN